jgi:hypothetical protein
VWQHYVQHMGEGNNKGFASHHVGRQTPPVRKIMFESISVVSRRHLIAAAAASALLCLAAVQPRPPAAKA